MFGARGARLRSRCNASVRQRFGGRETQAKGARGLPGALVVLVFFCSPLCRCAGWVAVLDTCRGHGHVSRMSRISGTSARSEEASHRQTKMHERYAALASNAP
jgi:hypothetical protein